MSVGKYSPTVSYSYAVDRDWFQKNGGGFGNGVDPESDDDDEGYDRYGYSSLTGEDRAGHTESNYLSYDEDFDCFRLYEIVQQDWSSVICGKDKVETYP